MPDTQATLERRAGKKFDPHNFEDALEMSGMVLAENLKKFGNVNDALRAYNGGWDRSKWGNDETSAYPGKVAKAGGFVVQSAPLRKVPVGGGMPVI